MYTSKENDQSITIQISSSPALVDRACRNLTEFWEGKKSSPGTFLQVVRELLMNGVEHGNRGDDSKTVECVVTQIAEGRYSVRVTDQGDGVTPEQVRLRAPEDPSTPRSRGYAIINAHADDISFDPENASVTAYLTAIETTEFPVEIMGDTQVIRPTGDISASVAEDFRDTLLSWANGEAKHLRLDLSSVQVMDSISLSVLVSFSKTLQSFGSNRDCELANAGSDLRTLFTMTGLNKLYPITSQTGENSDGD